MHRGYGYFEEDQLGQMGDVGLWQRIIGYTKPYWKGVAVAVLLSLVISATGLALPYLISIGVDTIVDQDLTVELRQDGLARVVVPFAVLMIIGFAANFLQVVLLEWTGQNIMHEMRQQLFKRLHELDLDFFNRNPVGKLVTRLTNDIQNMHEMFTSVIVTVFNDLIRIVGIFAVLFWMNWRLALVICLLIPMIALTTIRFSQMARDVFRTIRTCLARINSFLQEALSGISIIQIYRQEKHAAHTFEELNSRYFLGTMKQIRLFGFFMPLIDVFSHCSIALIIWYGGGEIIRERMSLGVLVAFLSYMRLFFQPLRELSQKFSIVQSAMASAERIFQILDTRPTLKTARNSIRLSKFSGSIAFERVRFGYETGQPIIHDFSLRIKPGETLAIVGATGSGKTTLINLLERFYDVEQGAVTLDDIDIKKLDRFWLREQIGLAMQDVFVIPASIRDNILLGKRLGDVELREIIDNAQLTEFVAALERGWYTRIGEGGMGLSSGQKQLLAFARVLARDPSVLILDEATSNVDSETERLIEQAIGAVLENRTSIVIAHRLSTIRRADRIVVMEHGRIVEQGSHEELLAAGGLYHYLLQLQNNSGQKITN